jgi:ABC-type multidrug transport system fused ATPase/permease subunit
MQSLTRETFKIYYKYARQQAGSFVIGWLFLFFYMAADVYRPTLFKRLFDGMAAFRSGSTSIDSLTHIIVLIFSLGLVTIIFRRIADYFVLSSILKGMKAIQIDVFKYVHGHSETFFNNQFIGGLVKRINRFVTSFDGSSNMDLV